MNEALNTNTYIQYLKVFNVLREDLLCSAIKTLQLPPGSRGLDAGCGVGLQALLLAEAVGLSGHVTGLDLSPEFLNHAEEIVARAGLSKRISFQKGDVNHLPFDDSAFDWAWSVDCVGYAPMHPLPLIKELTRVVKPGGRIAILAWSSEKLLPGYPLLEARLNATTSGIAPFTKGKRPGLHFLRALGWFRKLCLQELKVQTFINDAYAPLSENIYNALQALFQMRWMEVESELSSEDFEAYQRLCLPESPDFILNHPDYYAFFTYSMFHGRVDQG